MCGTNSRCVHIYSLYDDIHGCWKNGVVSGTPLFEMIGLMDRIRGLSAAELRFPLCKLLGSWMDEVVCTTELVY